MPYKDPPYPHVFPRFLQDLLALQPTQGEAVAGLGFLGFRV